MATKGKRVLIIAGEASGDLYGGKLVKAIRAVDSSVSFLGVGGLHMQEAGVKLLWNADEMGVVGLPGVKRLFTILSVFRVVSTNLQRWRPDLVVLIDYPEFNLFVAGKAKKLGISVMYYIGPQIWAWRSGRIRTIRRRVDRMVVILPFEERIYREGGVEVSFVGHPLLDVIRVTDEKSLTRSRYSKDRASRLVGLLPGSRMNEISKLLPVMLDTAVALAKEIPDIHFLMPLAPTIRSHQIDPHFRGRELSLTVVENNTHEVIQVCEMMIAASGTVTLEAAILGTPLVVVYKVNPLTYWLGKRLINVQHVALANIIAGETVAPELIQHEANPVQIAREAIAILGDSDRQAWIRQRFAEVRDSVGKPGASARTAAIAMELLDAR
ncbi:MAG: lipid-A-disaccharide synthase [Deltaproteobacteria bacterium]|nr:MAG: lipid-A-disaccharide synthase [Deltaproteobacteria bacterium]